MQGGDIVIKHQFNCKCGKKIQGTIHALDSAFTSVTGACPSCALKFKLVIAIECGVIFDDEDATIEGIELPPSGNNRHNQEPRHSNDDSRADSNSSSEEENTEQQDEAGVDIQESEDATPEHKEGTREEGSDSSSTEGEGTNTM